ncbi:hypothetical protein [Herbaspirillum sp. alder98]|uniref:hypothetical protein n=1 Tax=Herbaspirillum sp. alder98 TaxID=2913096 RepID=UPI001CD8B9B8|nr:hypothetical protein [Herbaspirillum sp. alder98]MCA1323763.1 hypothetical protein [Herbaspirillum sp. alder98]
MFPKDNNEKTMRYPNTRYGYHQELEYWMQGSSIKDVAKRLKRSERSVHDWMTGKRKVPWWVPEILRLQRMEWYDRMQQMNIKVPKVNFAFVTADVIEFPKPRPAVQPEMTPTAASATQPDTKTATS